MESFNSKLRDELFAREVFAAVMEARTLHADYTYAFSDHRSHSALGYLTPAAFCRGLDVANADRIKQDAL